MINKDKVFFRVPCAVLFFTCVICLPCPDPRSSPRYARRDGVGRGPRVQTVSSSIVSVWAVMTAQWLGERGGGAGGGVE